MQAGPQAHVAFYLTGKRPSAELDAVDGLDLRPALFAGHRDLTKLRYDFPLVLVRDRVDETSVQSLSGLFDRALEEIARGAEGEGVKKHVLALEREIRSLVAEGKTGSLSALRDMAAGRLSSQKNALPGDSLKRLSAAVKFDGELVDCDKALPVRLLNHAWRATQQKKAREFQKQLDRLIQKLSDILQADWVSSEKGRSPENLKAAIGPAQQQIFDFGAMSRLLAKASPSATLGESRRQRITGLLAVLRSQRFFPAPGAAGKPGDAVEPYAFVFQSCTAALKAYRARLPKAIELAKAVEMAELDINGEYDESKHDAFFEGFGANGLDPSENARFPDYLVLVNAGEMPPAETARLNEILAAGLPIKILAQTDDILEPSPVGDGCSALAVRGKQLVSSAIGLGGAYVLQSSGSNLFRFRDRLFRGLAFSGPALFSIFSGATDNAGDLPAYMVAAAAMESRAFAAFVYDPSAGPDWASRFYLEDNPQAESDWPVHSLAFEDEEHQRSSENLAFTLVDFLACDRRFAENLALVPRAKWNGHMVSVPECLADDPKGVPEKVPSLFMVDRDNRLQKVVVDSRLIREARRCAEMWHSLQELGGIHNSHAERLLARERKAWEEQAQREAESRPKPSQETPVPAAGAPAAVPQPVAEAEPEASSDEPSIETPRCTTCNECTQLNDKMFAYNQDKQAYIANPDAGTYAQLVEAAENCQVSIIHPGKPRNPNEPGLEELMARAAPFL